MIVRKLWKHEFSGENKNKYKNALLNNQTDVATMFSFKRKKNMVQQFFCFSKSFNLIGKVKIKKRMYYEIKFQKNKSYRVLRILRNKVKNSHASTRKFYSLFQLDNKK